MYRCPRIEFSRVAEYNLVVLNGNGRFKILNKINFIRDGKSLDAPPTVVRIGGGGMTMEFSTIFFLFCFSSCKICVVLLIIVYGQRDRGIMTTTATKEERTDKNKKKKASSVYNIIQEFRSVR